MKGWENVYYANINEKKARIAILVSDNVYFRAEKITATVRDIT